jgi:hypothetical protein
MKIICLAGDPGGARALSPVIAELRQRGVDLHLLGYRQGSAILQEHGLPVTVCDEHLAQHAAQYLQNAQADLLLTATSMNGQDFEKIFIQAASQCGLASLAVLDFWSNYRGRFTTRPPDGELDATPDQIAVMDARAVAEMVAQGFPPHQLVITGQPAYDELFQPVDVPATRQRVRTALGIAAEDVLLIYASQPFTEMTAETGIPHVSYDEMECLRLLLDSLQATNSLKIWVRPHPRETAAKFHALADPRLIISADFDRISAICAADGVTGMSSNFLLEAALLGLPVLSLQPRQQGTGPLPLVSLGLGEVITDSAAAPAAVTRWLTDCRQAERVHTLSNDSPFRPGAAARVADVVIDRMRQATAGFPQP